eukprot:275058-Alexandrium_andersonii.AAC.1
MPATIGSNRQQLGQLAATGSDWQQRATADIIGQRPAIGGNNGQRRHQLALTGTSRHQLEAAGNNWCQLAKLTTTGSNWP